MTAFDFTMARIGGYNMAKSPSNRVPPCPACGTPQARHLDGVSAEAVVDFFDCNTCHHFWAVDKRNRSKVSHITRLPPKPPAEAR